MDLEKEYFKNIFGYSECQKCDRKLKINKIFMLPTITTTKIKQETKIYAMEMKYLKRMVNIKWDRVMNE